MADRDRDPSESKARAPSAAAPRAHLDLSPPPPAAAGGQGHRADLPWLWIGPAEGAAAASSPALLDHRATYLGARAGGAAEGAERFAELRRAKTAKKAEAEISSRPAGLRLTWWAIALLCASAACSVAASVGVRPEVPWTKVFLTRAEVEASLEGSSLPFKSFRFGLLGVRANEAGAEVDTAYTSDACDAILPACGDCHSGGIAALVLAAFGGVLACSAVVAAADRLGDGVSKAGAVSTALASAAVSGAAWATWLATCHRQGRRLNEALVDGSSDETHFSWGFGLALMATVLPVVAAALLRFSPNFSPPPPALERHLVRERRREYRQAKRDERERRAAALRRGPWDRRAAPGRAATAAAPSGGLGGAGVAVGASAELFTPRMPAAAGGPREAASPPLLSERGADSSVVVVVDISDSEAAGGGGGGGGESAYNPHNMYDDDDDDSEGEEGGGGGGGTVAVLPPSGLGATLPAPTRTREGTGGTRRRSPPPRKKKRAGAARKKKKKKAATTTVGAPKPPPPRSRSRPGAAPRRKAAGGRSKSARPGAAHGKKERKKTKKKKKGPGKDEERGAPERRTRTPSPPKRVAASRSSSPMRPLTGVDAAIGQLQGTDAAWGERVALMAEVAASARSAGDGWDAERIRRTQRAVAAQVLDLRSSVVRGACEMYEALASGCGHKADLFPGRGGGPVLGPLLSRLYVTTKAVSTRARLALLHVVAAARSAGALEALAGLAFDDDHAALRGGCLAAMGVIFDKAADGRESVADLQADVCATVVRANLSHASASVRKAARATLASIVRAFPELEE